MGFKLVKCPYKQIMESFIAAATCHLLAAQATKVGVLRSRLHPMVRTCKAILISSSGTRWSAASCSEITGTNTAVTSQ